MRDMGDDPPFKEFKKQRDLTATYAGIETAWKPSDQAVAEVRETARRDAKKAKEDADKATTEAVAKANQERTTPARLTRTEKAKLRDKAFATALREVEKTIPLKSGLKYIKDNLRPRLHGHFVNNRPSDSTLKGIISRMKRGQL
jgi:vacuolar-type H+-ATPase subunit H